MSMDIVDKVLTSFDKNPGAAEAVLNAFAAAHGFSPAPGYLEFMRRSNGGEGPVGNRYLMLWRLEDLREQNVAYEVSKYAPRLFLFGSSGGGDAYAFDTRQSPATIVSVPFVGMSEADATLCGTTFEEFLNRLAE